MFGYVGRGEDLMKQEWGSLRKRLFASVGKLKKVALLCITLLLSNSLMAAQAATTMTETRVKLGQYDVPVRQWTDSNTKPRAIVVGIHGCSRSSGCFQPLAEHLTAKGFMLVCPDLRGHGEWYFAAKKPQDKIVDYKGSTDDVVNLINNLQTKYPSTPIFCMGESAGAMIALKVATRCPSINGLILSSVGTKPCIHDVPNIVRDVVAGLLNFDQPLDIKETMANYSSDEERVRAAAAADPMLKPGLSGRELLRTSMLLNQTASNASRVPDHIPVLMMQGKRDQIVEASSALQILGKMKCKEKQLAEFPCGHILLSTPYLRDDVISTMSDWLTKETSAQQTALLQNTSTQEH